MNIGLKKIAIWIVERTPILRDTRATRESGARITIRGLILQKILRFNGTAYWPTHFTSVISQPQNIKLGIGAAPGLSPNCYIQGVNGISIGDFTIVGPGVGIVSANHSLNEFSSHTADDPIRIGKNCWIGMNAVILPGVTIGDHSIVAAGCVVTKSYPEGRCIIAGTPGRIVRELDDTELSFGPETNHYIGFYRLGRYKKAELQSRLAPAFGKSEKRPLAKCHRLRIGDA